VSKRHQNNRRKTYGRRQHEVHERRQRDDQPDDLGMKLADMASLGLADRFALLDRRAAGLHYAQGD